MGRGKHPQAGGGKRGQGEEIGGTEGLGRIEKGQKAAQGKAAGGSVRRRGAEGRVGAGVLHFWGRC